MSERACRTYYLIEYVYASVVCVTFLPCHRPPPLPPAIAPPQTALSWVQSNVPLLTRLQIEEQGRGAKMKIQKEAERIDHAISAPRHPLPRPPPRPPSHQHMPRHLLFSNDSKNTKIFIQMSLALLILRLVILRVEILHGFLQTFPMIKSQYTMRKCRFEKMAVAADNCLRITDLKRAPSYCLNRCL